MVAGVKVDGATPAISPGIRKTIQSIKEIVGNHSDVDIYVALKETNMDPNETAQMFLNQDPFHEVKRKRSKNKEKAVNEGPAECCKDQLEIVDQGTMFNSHDQNNQRGDNYNKGERSQRGGYNQRGDYYQRGSGVFHRGGYNRRGDDDDVQRGDSAHKFDDIHKNDSVERDGGNQKDSSGPRHDDYQRDADAQYRDGNLRGVDLLRSGSFQRRNGFQRGSGVRRGVIFQRGGFARNPFPTNPVKSVEFRVVRDNRVNQNISQDASVLPQSSSSNNEETGSNVYAERKTSATLKNQKAAGAAIKGSSDEKVIESKRSDERTAPFQSNNTQRQAGKSKDSRPRSAGQASNSSVLGVYSSSSDPVHVPSPARSSTNGSFRREVGVVGVRKMPSDNSGKITSNAALAKINPTAESARPLSVSPKGTQSVQNTATGPAVTVMSGSRPFSNGNQYGHRSHQQPAGHQKTVQQSKEWKPKSSQKNAFHAAVSTESASPAADVSADGLKDYIIGGKLSDEHSAQGNQGVIIAEHIQVPNVDRCRVIFGSFGLDANLTNCDAPQTVGDALDNGRDLSGSVSVSPIEASNVDGTEHGSPESSAADDHQFSDGKDSSLQNSKIYADVGMVRSDSTRYAPELQKQHDIVGVGSYSTFDPQTGYDLTYFRQSDDEAARGSLSSSQEGFNSHVTGMVPSSQSLYQQQAQIAQMYPPVHVSHYMPYRQFIPPVYVPQMGVPSYSPNTAYVHPANGNGYILMPGGSSHLNASAMKYGAQQQFKPAPGSGPTGFGNYTTPNGYTVNAPGGMMCAAGTNDPSRHKYKDGNIYVQNPQIEAQELWMQNSREIPGLQPSPYYNMQGQAPHGIYMLSHPAHHTAYNPAAAAVAQSSHMQFPGLYHPQGQATPHHMAPSNIGVVGVPQPAPMAQVASACQQPQMNHLQWTSTTF